MLSTKDDEDEIVRWAFAEIINYLKRKHNRYWFKYNFKHWQIHKILYNIFEALEIPVTRSWYRYGCFIHSTQLAGFNDFSSLKNRYLSSYSAPKRLRSRAASLGIDVGTAINIMQEATDAIIPSRMNTYLESLYTDAPDGLGSIYLSKLHLYNLLYMPNKRSFRNSQAFHKWFLNVRNNLSIFHMAAFSNERFADLFDIVLEFSSNLEETILKIDSLSHEKNRILKKWSVWLGEFSEFFDENVWHPFALEISTITVKGLREEQEKCSFRKKKIEKIHEASNALSELKKELTEKGLTLTHQDYLEKIKKSAINKNVSDTISTMEKIYEKY
jgi:hypothetical protein